MREGLRGERTVDGTHDSRHRNAMAPPPIRLGHFETTFILSVGVASPTRPHIADPCHVQSCHGDACYYLRLRTGGLLVRKSG